MSRGGFFPGGVVFWKGGGGGGGFFFFFFFFFGGGGGGRGGVLGRGRSGERGGSNGNAYMIHSIFSSVRFG